MRPDDIKPMLDTFKILFASRNDLHQFLFQNSIYDIEINWGFFKLHTHFIYLHSVPLLSIGVLDVTKDKSLDFLLPWPSTK